MKAIIFVGLCLYLSVLCAGSPQEVEAFLSTYSGTPYQDLIIQNKCVRKGTDICAVRYEMLKPILDLFQRPFSVLDIGAAEGYFSFKIAHDYPQSKCIMIGANCNYYSNHGDMLYHLCHLNSNLSNITYLNKFINRSDLEYLNRNEHFDVVLALLVIHMIDESITERLAIIKTLLKLGDYVIIEVSNDVAPDLAVVVETLCKKMDCIYIGEVKRHNNIASKSTGKLFCFSKKDVQNNDSSHRIGITKETFTTLNGVYP